jgi:uncharacterized protein (TIGR02996 family)
MSSRTSFLRAILDAPEEDAPRLVYADWLEEQGDPRGEFIRLQVEAARGADPLRRRELQRSAAAILEIHEAEWLAPIRSFLARWQFRRGFVEAIDIETLHFLSRAERIWEVEPVTSMNLLGVGQFGSAIAVVPQLTHLRRLNVGIHATLGDDGFEPLTTTPYLVNLRVLNAWGCRLGDASARAIAVSPNLHRLSILDLSNNRIGSSGAFALARSPYLQHISKIRLYRNAIGTEAAQGLRVRFGRNVVLD